ncbi:DUF4386 family protein [Rhodococcus sp. IEGM 1330]|uniref:DUF4386 family protein n=1 Tax=Rhodococcus sp. IEGM 1330 TaxID=3082225 RepID=UPI00295407CA|nr:DUF4386 family protein [Rhodococcus sp. IEGM 1330]MDV8021627.1 DUF4386 family protein [Rhodococcus sp. IEGM 1330]
MTDRRSTAALLIAFTALNFVAVMVLGAAFGWPAVLDEPAAVVLPAFAAAQGPVVAGFLLQTMLSVALVPIAIGLHQQFVSRASGEGPRLWPLTVAVFGILAGLTQTLGWIRWPLTVPGLAATWLDPATSPEVRTATEVSYDLLNSYAGGALGEYLGWSFQALWAVGIAVLLVRTRVVSAVTAVAGLVLTAAWGLSFLVGPFYPALADGVAGTAGFTAYAAWFCWLGVVGVALLRQAPALVDAR